MTDPRSSRPEPVSNRVVLLGAVGLVVVLLLGILIVVLAGDDTPAGSPPTSAPVPITTPDGAVVPSGDSPSIIPRPNEGTGPVEAGDPGGAAQLALFGLLALSIAGIGFMIFHGGKKTQANRARWLAAAEQPEPPATGSTEPHSTETQANETLDSPSDHSPT
ncbi:MAG: hypothetical protein ABI239_13345 [Aquihabitans sp.]